MITAFTLVVPLFFAITPKMCNGAAGESNQNV